VLAVVTSSGQNDDHPEWTFFTNHGHVLVCIAQDPQVRITDIGRLVGIGERAAHRIVHDLIEAGYVVCTKVGRRNTYEVRFDRPLRHPLEAQHLLAEVFEPITRSASPVSAGTATASSSVARRPK
jgi:predicted transcriptional regulator